MIKSETKNFVPEVVGYEWAKNNSSLNFCKCCNSHWCKSFNADIQITGSSKALNKLKSMHKKRSKSDPISHECYECYESDYYESDNCESDYYESDYYDDF